MSAGASFILSAGLNTTAMGLEAHEMNEVVTEAPVRQEGIFTDISRQCLIIERQCLHDDV